MTIQFYPQILAYLKKHLEFHKSLVLPPNCAFLIFLLVVAFTNHEPFSLHRFSFLYSVHILSPPPFNFQHRLFLYFVSFILEHMHFSGPTTCVIVLV